MSKSILVVGAHPDDYEFGCGAVLLKAVSEGIKVHPVIFSLGESGTAGTPEIRREEAQNAAEVLGSELIELLLDGDAKLEESVENRIKLARLIRELKPDWVLAPSHHLRQHPDHVAASNLARNAVRLARYGGFKELKDFDPHRQCKVAFYDISNRSNLTEDHPIVVDVSGFKDAWVDLMNCHASQTSNQRYVELQVARATALGIENDCDLAQKLLLESAPVFGAVEQIIEGKKLSF